MKEYHVVTHNGSFHPDDVFSVAALAILFSTEGSTYRVTRTRDPHIISGGDYVVDVGAEYDTARRRFDHHQRGGAGARASGVPYASFGLVWKEFGTRISGSNEVVADVDATLVQPIDLTDNGSAMPAPMQYGVYPYTIDDAVYAFRPTWKEEADFDRRFLELVPLALKIIEREVVRAAHRREGETEVEKSYTAARDKRILVLDRVYTWKYFTEARTEVLFVVYPDESSANWCVQAIRLDLRTFGNRKNFPREWAGKRDAELASVTGVPDAVFCHNAQFFAVAKSKDGAISLAKRALGADS